MRKKEQHGKFQIDFFELCFLAEACIPVRPIARAMFWQSLSSFHWHKMSPQERESMFNWMNRNGRYEESLAEKHEDTLDFHYRFDPDNQYSVTTLYKGEEKVIQSFKKNDSYYIDPRTSIIEQYITKIEKL